MDEGKKRDEPQSQQKDNKKKSGTQHTKKLYKLANLWKKQQ